MVEEQGQEMRAGRRAVEDAVRALRVETARALRRLEEGMAQPQTTGAAQGAAAPPGAAQSMGRTTLRREFPDLVTREPAADDAEVFGGAWSLIVEWRELKDTHPSQGRGLSWLVAEERRLVVELTLLEEHGLTLPPQTYPLRGLDRAGQTSWRKTALYDTRQARARREHLRWVRRVCSLGSGGSNASGVVKKSEHFSRGACRPFFCGFGSATMVGLFGFTKVFRP